jgi:hypothetical protein
MKNSAIIADRRKDKRKMGKIKCRFCEREIEEPINIDKSVRKCLCGAIYWLEFADDLWLVPQEAADYFGLNKKIKQTKIEVTRNFDIIDGREEICLVFARLI